MILRPGIADHLARSAEAQMVWRLVSARGCLSRGDLSEAASYAEKVIAAAAKLRESGQLTERGERIEHEAAEIIDAAP